MSELKSTVTYDEKVIQKIVGHALENIEGLLDVSGGFFSNVKDKLVNSDDVTTGVNVEVGKEEVATDLDIIVEYGKDIPSIAEGIKATIIQNVEVMTHLKVVEINVNVVDVMTREDFEASSVTVQDRVEAGYEKAKEDAKEARDYVAEKAEDAKEFTSEKVAQAKEYTSEKAEDAKTFASEKSDQVKATVSEENNDSVTYTATSDDDVVVD